MNVVAFAITLVRPANELAHSEDVDDALDALVLQHFADRFSDVIDVDGRDYHGVCH